MSAAGTDRLDLIGVGQCSIDHVCSVEGIPSLGGKAAMLAYEVLPGGQVATAALAATRLGLRAAYVGTLGSDPQAEIAVAALAAAGVDLDGVRRIPGASTRLAVILVDRASGERTILGYRDPRLRLQPDEVPCARIASARCLLVDAEDPAASLRAARAAREAGVPVVADLDTLSEAALTLLPLIDFPLVSRAFAEQLGMDGRVRSGLRRLVETGARMAVVTLGDRGCLAQAGDREIVGPGFSIAPRDTTGAGDVFHAGFVAGLLDGVADAELLRFANAAAALSCRALGAQGGLPTRAEVDAFLVHDEPAPWRDPDAR